MKVLSQEFWFVISALELSPWDHTEAYENL